MAEKPTEEEVLSLEEVFQDQDIFRLALSEEEWEVIIALAEAGGSGTVDSLRKATRMSKETIRKVIRALLNRGVVEQGTPAEPPTDERIVPDAEVSQYLDYLKDLNYYQVLQLNPDATREQIRRAYFRLMREYSPDRFMKEKNPETREQLKEIFRLLTRAYETLFDPETRREYDLTIPDFTGALEREDELAFETIWSGTGGPEPLPEANPELAKSFYENALEDFKNEDFASAELNFKLAAALDPENNEYQAGLAKTRGILNKRKAKEAAIKAIYQEDEGKVKLAIRHLLRAVELDPETPEYRYDLARLLQAHTQDLHGARMHILMALDKRPGKVPYLLLLAQIQKRLGESEDARRTYKKILSLDPKNEEAKKGMEELGS